MARGFQTVDTSAELETEHGQIDLVVVRYRGEESEYTEIQAMRRKADRVEQTEDSVSAATESQEDRSRVGTRCERAPQHANSTQKGDKERKINRRTQRPRRQIS